jgi:hypothetical protein
MAKTLLVAGSLGFISSEISTNFARELGYALPGGRK